MTKNSGANGDKLAAILAMGGIPILAAFLSSSGVGFVETRCEDSAKRVRGALIHSGFRVPKIRRSSTTAGKTWLVAVAVA